MNHNSKLKLYPLTDFTQSIRKQQQVRVLAKASEWLNTGVIIKKGVVYKVAAEGRWHGGPICGWTGPDGQGAGTQCFLSIIPGWSISTLIGRVGQSGNPFAIGNKYQFTTQQDGILYLRMNEPPSSCLDNGGYVTAVISLANDSVTKEKNGESPNIARLETIDVKLKGIDDGIKSSRQEDYKQAVLFAKREAIERSGVEIKSISKVENLALYEDFIEAKAQAVLLGGYEILDLGYSEDGLYQVVLIGKIRTSKTQ